LLERQEKQVQLMNEEMDAVAEPVLPAAQGMDMAADEAESENEESGEPSILGAWNED
jgi:hypothetical protein